MRRLWPLLADRMDRPTTQQAAHHASICLVDSAPWRKGCVMTRCSDPTCTARHIPHAPTACFKAASSITRDLDRPRAERDRTMPDVPCTLTPAEWVATYRGAA